MAKRLATHKKLCKGKHQENWQKQASLKPNNLAAASRINILTKCFAVIWIEQSKHLRMLLVRAQIKVNMKTLCSTQSSENAILVIWKVQLGKSTRMLSKLQERLCRISDLKTGKAGMMWKLEFRNFLRGHKMKNSVILKRTFWSFHMVGFCCKWRILSKNN